MSFEVKRTEVVEMRIFKGFVPLKLNPHLPCPQTTSEHLKTYNCYLNQLYLIAHYFSYPYIEYWLMNMRG